MPNKMRGQTQSLAVFGMEGGRVRRTMPVVVYAPKYDENLREEGDINITADNRFELRVTKVGKRNVDESEGTFDSYDDAKKALFEKFFRDFNRPSENAIRHAGRSPAERVWDYTPEGRELKNSVSIIEGEKKVEVVSYTPKSLTITIPKGAPLEISIRTLYPRYFTKMRQRKATRKWKMTGVKRFFRKRRFYVL